MCTQGLPVLLLSSSCRRCIPRTRTPVRISASRPVRLEQPGSAGGPNRLDPIRAENSSKKPYLGNAGNRLAIPMYG